MPVVGQVAGIGKTERIFAVRFLGDKAFVVTFRQTDPFYTLDMSDPTNPTVVGELKIPGFSNYLHPIGDGSLILAVGKDADERGREKGLQISMFDVTDFANPIKKHNFTLADSTSSYSSSEAQWDHQAFRYLEGNKLLIIPVSMYDYSEFGNSFDGFSVYNVDEVEGISERVFISHADAEAINNFGLGYCWSDSSLPSRSLVFSGDVMTLKSHTVQSHNLGTLLMEGEPINLDSRQIERLFPVFYGCNRRHFGMRLLVR